MDRMLGLGAGDLVANVTLNNGTIRGGVKVNMIPSSCVFEADFRLPIGMSKADLLPRIAEIAERFPEATWREIGGSEPSWCDPGHEMVGIIQANVEALGHPRPTPTVGLGGTDARLWCHRGIPAYVYGPRPHGMGSHDEYCKIGLSPQQLFGWRRQLRQAAGGHSEAEVQFLPAVVDAVVSAPAVDRERKALRCKAKADARGSPLRCRDHRVRSRRNGDPGRS